MKLLQTLLLTAVFLSGFAQNNTGDINDRIQLSQEYTFEVLYADSAFLKLSNALIVNAGIELQIGNADNRFFRATMFLVDENEVYSFDSYSELFQSAEFLATIRPDFRLKTREDALSFQSFLYLVDESYFHEGFFRQGNDWYFVRRQFFGDIIAWKVTTDAKGKIVSVEYGDMQITLPDEMLEAGNQTRYYEAPDMPQISEEAHRHMEQYALSQLNYSIEEREAEAYITEKVTRAKFSELSLLLTEEQEGFSFTEINRLWVMELEDSAVVYASIEQALTSSDFISSLQPGFVLQTREDALTFEIFLDQVSDFDRSDKACVQKNNQWFFIRSSFFDDAIGYIVTTDEAGIVQSIRFDERIDMNAPQPAEEEPFDESTADWGFRLVDFPDSSFVVAEGTELYVQVDFNEEPVNRAGAWILSRFNGSNMGMVAGTEIYAPYTDHIPAEYLTPGKHAAEVFLLRPGMDEENPLAKVSLDIEVKPFSPEGVDWGFHLLEPTRTDFVAEAGKMIPVEIAFNQEAVRENGVHLLIRYQGDIVGGEKAEHMNAPFQSFIPGEVLTQGFHKVEFLLMPPGKEEAESALEVITFNLEVKN